MHRMYTPARIVCVFIVMALFLTLYVSALYGMQVYEVYTPAGEAPPQMKTYSRTVTLPSARGNIYDRNGVLLASGRPSYNIVIDRRSLIRDSNCNEMIRDLVYTAMDRDVAYNDTFPVTKGAPFNYPIDISKEQQRRLDEYLDFFSLDSEISASDLLAFMRSHYGIDYTVGIADARLIIGVRYELEIRAIIGTLPNYVFAGDVSADFVTLVESMRLTGVSAEAGYVREYYTTYAPHLIGYIQPMNKEQYEKYSELGYPMDALVGQTGAEYAFEKDLHGVDGKQIIKTDETGAIMDITTLVEPKPGNHIYLTIDLGLQIMVEHALSSRIAVLNLEREEEEQIIQKGAVVVLDVNTGELLAAATYPSYNPQTLSADFAQLSIDPGEPMMNKATTGRYNPGSTFKMITAFAGLRHGVITRDTQITDLGRYTRWEKEGFTATCWLWNSVRGATHGAVNVVQALECSCNYFFMTVADRFAGGSIDGAYILADVAQEFGLGRSTGLEIAENTGRVATPAWKKAANIDNGFWAAADTVLISFGQGNNVFTPVQLANYAATIASGGILHKLTILRRIKSADFSELLYSTAPVVLGDIPEKEYIAYLQEGMRQVARGRSGTAAREFRDYPIPVAAKTGTVQSETNEVNNGIFVCYAPADKPEIAISIVIEQGGSGSAVMEIARTIFDSYFQSELTVRAVPYGELIP